MREAIASAAGLATSLLLETVPYVRDRWANNQFKVLTLLLIHVGSAVAIWALSCYVKIEFPFYIPCGYQGLAEVGWIGAVAFGSSQLTYQAVTKRLPQVTRRKIEAARQTIYESYQTRY